MRRQFVLAACLVLAALACVGGVYAAAQILVSHSVAKSQTAACSRLGRNHVASIVDNRLRPAMTYGARCDTLTITNHDARLRLIAFGQHEHHTAYDHVIEKLLDQGQSLTVVLNQTGRFTFHDHLDDSVIGYFTVNQ